MQPANPTNRLHAQHPFCSRKSAGAYRGQISTRKTAPRGSVLQADSQPAIFPFKEYHNDGALMSYGPNVREAARKIAIYVDKILKGTNPSELPIEQMSKHELIIDLRVARAMGIRVPQELLQRADEVIK